MKPVPPDTIVLGRGTIFGRSSTANDYDCDGHTIQLGDLRGSVPGEVTLLKQDPGRQFALIVTIVIMCDNSGLGRTDQQLFCCSHKL
jgi:hypothetical protein